MAGSNDLNMLLKSRVVQIRAELDLKNSMPKIRQQVDAITKRLAKKPVKLRVSLDYKLADLFKQRQAIQNRLNQMPLRLRTQLDMGSTSKAFAHHFQGMNKTIDDFNRNYNSNMQSGQKQAQGSIAGTTAAATVAVSKIKEVETSMKRMHGNGLFGTQQFKDANGNIKGFVAQLENANGVVQKVRYDWDSKAGKFMPINKQTIDSMERHVNRASNSLQGLRNQIIKLNDGSTKNSIFRDYQELEKRIGKGTLTQDSVRGLRERVNAENTLQSVIKNQNKQYLNQEKLVQRIAKARSAGWMASDKGANAVQDRNMLNGMITSVRNDGSADNLAKQSFELDKYNERMKHHNVLQRDLANTESRRMRYQKELDAIRRQTPSFDKTSQGLMRQIQLQTQSAKSMKDWMDVQKNMDRLRSSNANATQLRNMENTQHRLEEVFGRIHRLTDASPARIQRDMNRVQAAFGRGFADLNTLYSKEKRRLDKMQSDMRGQMLDNSRILMTGQTHGRHLGGITSAIDRQDTEALKQYVGQMYRGRVETINMERTTDNLGRTVDRMRVGMASSGKTARTYTVDLDRMNNTLRQSHSGLNYNANRNLGVMEQLRIAMARVPVWMTAMTAFYGTLRSFQAMTREVLELDKAFTQLRRVASDSLNIDGLFQNTITLSKELGNNVHEVLDTMNDFARTYGEFNERQLLAITNTATLMSNVSDITAKEAGESLVATMNAFNIEAEESIRIVDALNEVDIITSLPVQKCA